MDKQGLWKVYSFSTLGFSLVGVLAYRAARKDTQDQKAASVAIFAQAFSTQRLWTPQQQTARRPAAGSKPAAPLRPPTQPRDGRRQHSRPANVHSPLLN